MSTAIPEPQIKEGLAKAFSEAVDAEYPIPDNPHASVILRATDNRAAMWRGIKAAVQILAVHEARPVEPAAAKDLDLSASALMKLWQQAEELATDTMPAPFQYAKLLLGK